MTELQFSVLFCDDVRHEVGGKLTIVGMYRGFIGFRAPPEQDRQVLRPQLVAFLTIRHGSEHIGELVKVRLCDRDASIAGAEFSLTAPSAESAAAMLPTDPHYANVPIELVPFVPEHGMRLRVEVECGTTKFVSDELQIRFLDTSPDGTASGLHAPTSDEQVS